MNPWVPLLVFLSPPLLFVALWYVTDSRGRLAERKRAKAAAAEADLLREMSERQYRLTLELEARTRASRASDEYRDDNSATRDLRELIARLDGEIGRHREADTHRRIQESMADARKTTLHSWMAMLLCLTLASFVAYLWADRNPALSDPSQLAASIDRLAGRMDELEAGRDTLIRTFAFRDTVFVEAPAPASGRAGYDSGFLDFPGHRWKLGFLVGGSILFIYGGFLNRRKRGKQGASDEKSKPMSGGDATA